MCFPWHTAVTSHSWPNRHWSSPADAFNLTEIKRNCSSLGRLNLKSKDHLMCFSQVTYRWPRVVTWSCNQIGTEAHQDYRYWRSPRSTLRLTRKHKRNPVKITNNDTIVNKTFGDLPTRYPCDLLWPELRKCQLVIQGHQVSPRHRESPGRSKVIYLWPFVLVTCITSTSWPSCDLISWCSC